MQTPIKLVRRIETIEAIQYTGSNVDAINAYTGQNSAEGHEFSVHTINGPIKPRVNDWVVKISDGTFFIRRADYIDQHYYPVSPAPLYEDWARSQRRHRLDASRERYNIFHPQPKALGHNDAWLLDAIKRSRDPDQLARMREAFYGTWPESTPPLDEKKDDPRD